MAEPVVVSFSAQYPVSALCVRPAVVDKRGNEAFGALKGFVVLGVNFRLPFVFEFLPAAGAGDTQETHVLCIFQRRLICVEVFHPSAEENRGMEQAEAMPLQGSYLRLLDSSPLP